jgi:hypothetical protein
MKDFKGNEINIGDTIIACEGFTKTMVKAQIPDYTGYVSKYTQRHISPEKTYVIK